MNKTNTLVVVILYALILPILSYVVSPPLKAFTGVILVVISTILWGIKGGLIAALWSSLVAVSDLVLDFDELGLDFVMAGVIIYFTIGIAFGRGIDVIRQQRDALDEKDEQNQKIQKLLRESELRIRSLVSNVPGVIYRCSYDAYWTMEFMSDEIQSISGYPPSKFIDNRVKSYSDIIYFQDLDMVRTAIKRAVEKEEPFDIQYRIVCADNTIKWVNEKGQGVLGDEGKLWLDGVIFDITEKKQAQEALVSTKSRYHTLVDAVPDIIMQVDSDGKYVWGNQQGVEFFGEDYREHHFTDFFVNPDDVEDAIEKTAPLFNGQDNILEIETLLKRKDGEQRFLQWNCRPLILEQKCVGLLSTARDITEYRKVQEEKEDLGLIINRGPAVAFKWKNEDDWPVEFVSKNIDQFGYTVDDFYSGSMPYTRFLHPDDLKRCLEQIKEHIREKRTKYELIYRIIKKDGSYRWVRDWTWNVYDEKGKCLQHEGIVLDITEQKEAESALAAEKERLAVTLRSIGDGVVATDSKGNVTLLNQVAERLTGWNERDALGRTLDEVFHIINENTREVCENPVQKVLNNGEVVGLANHTALINKDGREISIADSAAPIFNNQGKIIGVVLVFRDITAEKEADLKLERMYKQTNQRLAESQSIQHVTAALLEKINIEEILEIVCDEATDLTKSKNSCVLMLKEDSLEVAFAVGDQSPECDSVSIEDSFIGSAIQKGESVIKNEPGLKEQGFNYDTLLATPLKVKDDIIGVLTVSNKQEGYTKEDIRIMTLLANHAVVAIENSKLYKQVQELAAVEERQRLARDLHDAVTQQLFSASLIAEVLPRLWKINKEEAEHRVEELRQLTRGTMAEMRTLLLELRPSGITEVKMRELLRHLAEAVTGRARIPVTVKIKGDCDLPPDHQVAFYRIAQESLNNAVKHSGATNIYIEMNIEPEKVILTVKDNGKGFNPETVSADHLGLGIMSERAQEVGALLKVDTKLGCGTQIKVTWQR